MIAIYTANETVNAASDCGKKNKVKSEMWAKIFALKRTKYCYFIRSSGCLSVTTGNTSKSVMQKPCCLTDPQ